MNCLEVLMNDLKQRLRVLDQAATPDVWDDVAFRASAASPYRRHSAGRIITIAVSLARCAAGAIFAWRAFDEAAPIAPAQPHGSQEAPPSSDVDLVCNEDGTTTARSDVLTATAKGVPVTVWSPIGGRQLWVQMPSWMPFDNQSFSLEQGENALTFSAPPGETTMGCLDAPAGLGRAAVTISIVDPSQFFGPATVDCGGDAPVRSIFSVLSAL